MKLIFDFGGVIFTWSPAALLARELPHRTTTPEATQALVDAVFQGYNGDWSEFDRGVVEADALARRIAARTGLEEAEVHRIIAGVPNELQPMAESVALLRELKDRGHTLYFLSNMPAPYADHLEREHHFLRWFQDGVFSARVQLIKPDRRIFEHTLARFGLPAAHCVFFDDHLPNIEAADACGLVARRFTTTAQARSDLEALGLL